MAKLRVLSRNAAKANISLAIVTSTKLSETQFVAVPYASTMLTHSFTSTLRSTIFFGLAFASLVNLSACDPSSLDSAMDEDVDSAAPVVDDGNDSTSDEAPSDEAVNYSAARRDTGSLYVINNDPLGNQVWRYRRADDGSLTLVAIYPTGGNGTGRGLGSQGAVTLSDDGRWLAAVNPGSDSVSLFEVGDRGALELLDVEPSTGSGPISVTMHDDAAYVLNGNDHTIAGFRLNRQGLTPLNGAKQTLSGEGGAQIEFTPEGRHLVVTLKASNAIDVFPLNRHDVAGLPITTPSNGMTPFGFAFARNGVFVVADAAGGAAGASTASSYWIDRRGEALPADHQASQQSAACWAAATDNGRFVYIANTGSSSITGYGVRRDGTLTALSADGVTATTGMGSRPADLAIADGFLYTRNGGIAAITIHQVEKDGLLTAVGVMPGLPASAAGLAAD